mmetsp:Transcript_7935/g.12153  ORF Transcript_7935/g.12153 Transcript_7935/m.12153 type:complete len:677 (+) Transcript_7935:62-2092(+)
MNNIKPKLSTITVDAIAIDGDAMVCENWRKSWQEGKGIEAQDLLPDWEERSLTFLQHAREKLSYQTFIARDSMQDIVGSISCQVWAGPVPLKVVEHEVFSLGAMWALHVAAPSESEKAEHIAILLIHRAFTYLSSLGCKRALFLAPDDTTKKQLIAAGMEKGNMLTMALAGDIDFETNIFKATDQEIQICKETANLDSLVCENWRKMWEEVGIPETGFVHDMDQITLDFLKDARKRLGYQTFVARCDGKIVGTISCQAWEGPFPLIVKPTVFQLGTIWAVYVIPSFRRLGVATALMRAALKHLRDVVRCDTAILIAASYAGQCVYERLGFAANNALVRDLPADSDTVSNSCSDSISSETSTDTETEETNEMRNEFKSQLSKLGVAINNINVNAFLTATKQQLDAVFFNHPQREAIFRVVSKFQSSLDTFVDPEDNWFSQNVRRFGRGFDLKKLSQDPEKLAKKFDLLSTHYDHWTVGNRSKVESFIVKCSKRLQESDGSNLSIMDVACGIGLQGQVLRMLGYKGMLVGNDISSGMIARALSRACYDQVYVANANEGLLVVKETPSLLFDVVICTGAMELLDQPRALKHMADILKSGGEIWVSFQHDTSSTEDSVENPTSHQNIRGLRKEEVNPQMMNAGFDIVSMETCSDAFFTPSPAQDGSLLPVPYLFVVGKKR